MASSTNPLDLQDIVRSALILNQVYIGSLAFILYDHFLTLHEEVRYMWPCDRIEIGKILFFLNRYLVPAEYAVTLYGFLATPSITVCKALYTFQEFSSLASLAVVQIVLLTRTWILWGASKLLLATLIIFLVGCLYATGILLRFISNGQDFLVDPELNIGCVVIQDPDPWFWTFWLPIIAFDLVLFLLTLVKVIQHRREVIHGPLVDILHRDGLIYFALSLGLGVANMIIFALAPVHLKSIALPLMTATLCVTCSRMLLNVRHVGEHIPSPEPSESTFGFRADGFELDVLRRRHRSADFVQLSPLSPELPSPIRRADDWRRKVQVVTDPSSSGGVHSMQASVVSAGTGSSGSNYSQGALSAFRFDSPIAPTALPTGRRDRSFSLASTALTSPVSPPSTTSDTPLRTLREEREMHIGLAV
ncbi:hypothetical protein CALCODRAFT_483834 [Calocera cornea HHB12733]|uniref:DUF6533 domain-containing protein n=1 Tax=Calocera cornea HHB12733 TaxID=1353952 RepID=A0A165FD83_9BASI|nr:hypothetical protein CALCODRAFT_483834 [Calocera cornea HHB12733]